MFSAFVGERNGRDEPDGFVRMINQFGNVCEGTVTPDGKMNGFCILYVGAADEIHVGWHRHDRRHGNWM